jgi:hypothetical protein
VRILLNYADGKFLESQFKNSQTGLAAGFNVVYQMSRGDINANFIEQNKEIMFSKRGVGYWLWKSYFINKILTDMSSDDMLFYADAGSVFIKRMEPIFHQLSNDPVGVIGFRLAGGHIERRYTKRDLLKHMNMNTSEYADSPQRMASFMCFRGTDAAKKLAKEYLDLCCTPHLINDSPNSDGWIEPDFVDHRHDQSIWSLLTKKHGVTILPDPTQWGVQHGESTEEQQFLFHTRDPK